MLNYFDRYWEKVQFAYRFVFKDTKDDFIESYLWEEYGVDKNHHNYKTMYEDQDKDLLKMAFQYLAPLFLLALVIVGFLLRIGFRFVIEHKFITILLIIVGGWLFLKFKKYMIDYYNAWGDRLFNILLSRKNEFETTYVLNGSDYKSISLDNQSGLYQDNKKLHIFRYKIKLYQGQITQQDKESLENVIYTDMNENYKKSGNDFKVELVENYGYLDIVIYDYKTRDEYFIANPKNDVTNNDLEDDNF